MKSNTIFLETSDWKWVHCCGGYYLQSMLLNKNFFDHGFFTRLWGKNGPYDLTKYFNKSESIHQLNQIHGCDIIEASNAKYPPWPKADALISDQIGQSLWIYCADCTPVLIADIETGNVASCHAGWRGISKGIVTSTIKKLENNGTNKRSILVALGPSIDGLRYQVKDDVINAIISEKQPQNYKNINYLQIRKSELIEKKVFWPDTSQGYYRLDIKRAIKVQLLEYGINSEQISICPFCTFKKSNFFYSRRRSNSKKSQWSGIVSNYPNNFRATDSAERIPSILAERIPPA